MAYLFGAGNTNRINPGTGVPQSTSVFTVAAWITLTQDAALQREIFSFGTAAETAWNCFFDFTTAAQNSLRVGFSQGGGSAFSACDWASTMVVGNQHLVIGDYDGSNLHLYADNDPVAKASSAAGPGSPDTGTMTAMIGNHPSGATTYSFDGTVAELSWWHNTVLSAANRLTLYACVSPLALPVKPSAYWPLIRSPHELRNSNTGTVTGATVADHPRMFYPAFRTPGPQVTSAVPIAVAPMVSAGGYRGGASDGGYGR